MSRHGKVAHVSAYGQRDREEGLPVEPDTLWRVYSMTKPITSVAAMMLHEQACDAWASLPLLFQPGAEWNYGVSTDVLGASSRSPPGSRSTPSSPTASLARSP